MKKIAVILCLILLFQAVTYAKGATVFVTKTDETTVQGKLLAVREHSLVLVQQAKDHLVVPVSEIMVVSWLVKKKRPWQLIAGGAALGGVKGLLDNDGPSKSRPYDILVGALSGVFIGYVASVLVGSSEKSGQISFRGLSHEQKLNSLRTLRKYALIKELSNSKGEK